MRKLYVGIRHRLERRNQRKLRRLSFFCPSVSLTEPPLQTDDPVRRSGLVGVMQLVPHVYIRPWCPGCCQQKMPSSADGRAVV